MEREDLAGLIAHGHALGLRMACSPSVTPRLDHGAIQLLRDAGAQAISLSLDGSTAASHDRFRRVDGVFDATMRAIQHARDVGLRVQINTTVTAGNAAELADILRLVLATDIRVWSVFFLVPTGRGSGLEPLDARDTEDVLHWLHDKSDLVAIKTTEAPQYRRVVLQRSEGAEPREPGALGQKLRAASSDLCGEPGPVRPRRRPIDVNSGNGFIFIDHRGDVYPSGFLPLVVGSVRDRSIVDLYRASAVLRQLRDPDALGGKCGVCEYRDLCGGSRSRAFALTGDALGEDPSCAYLPGAWSVPDDTSRERDS